MSSRRTAEPNPCVFSVALRQSDGDSFSVVQVVLPLAENGRTCLAGIGRSHGKEIAGDDRGGGHRLMPRALSGMEVVEPNPDLSA